MAATGKASVVRLNDPYLNCFKFGIVAAIFYAVIVRVPNRFYEPLNHATALMTGFLLSQAGAAPIVQGATVALKNFKAEIITECSGIYLAVLFAAFVVAYPATLKARLTGILLGIPFLNAANILRLAGVIAIGAWRPGLFKYAHVYLAQVMMVMLVCVTCLAWYRWAAAVRAGDTPFDFLVRFVAVASILFILWLPIHREYVALLDRLVIYLFSMIDFMLFIPPRPEIYHHTLSLVVFASLVLASRGIGARRKAYGLAAGLFLLALAHILFRVTHVLLTAFHMESVLPIHLTIHVINQYLLPVLFWLAVIRQRKAPTACPLCGAQKVGMLHHISAVHGREAMEDPRVRPLLEEPR
jgi:exosortase H (IPTLxxWG-CTERM-specific)